MARKTELPSLAHQDWLLDERLQQVMAVLSQEGGDVRVVGGAVRNALLGIAVADVDLATTHLPQDVVRLCSAANFGVHLTGFEHGTVTITNNGNAFEITSLRRDVSTDGRRATVEYSTNWAEDASRRDFTFNAMYCDAAGKCYDYTDGYDDILKRQVKFVGEASRRIEEDFLRILRFFRFHACYGEGAPDKYALDACVAKKHGLKNLSVERIRQEMLKLLVAPRAIETLKLMAQVKVLAQIIPHTDEWRALRRLPADALLRLFVLAQTPEELHRELKLSNADAQRLDIIASLPFVSPHLSEREQKALLYGLGPGAFRDAAHLYLAQSKDRLDDSAWLQLLTLPDRWQAPVLPVNGNDLRANGIEAGPRLGDVLRELEDWWLASDFKPGKEELLQRVKAQDGK